MKSTYQPYLSTKWPWLLSSRLHSIGGFFPKWIAPPSTSPVACPLDNGFLPCSMIPYFHHTALKGIVYLWIIIVRSKLPPSFWEKALNSYLFSKNSVQIKENPCFLHNSVSWYVLKVPKPHPLVVPRWINSACAYHSIKSLPGLCCILDFPCRSRLSFYSF